MYFSYSELGGTSYYTYIVHRVYKAITWVHIFYLEPAYLKHHINSHYYYFYRSNTLLRPNLYLLLIFEGGMYGFLRRNAPLGSVTHPSEVTVYANTVK